METQMIDQRINKGKKGLIIGRATFKDTFTNKKKKQFITKQVSKTLSQNIWKLQYNKYVDQKWMNIISQMQTITCQRIDLHSNQQPQILKNLAIPCFTNLVTLVLQKNKIENIEALTFVNMETLNFLDLDDNCITSLKSFNKLKWPQLRKLQIRNNLIPQIQFSRMKIKHEMQKIYLDEMFDRQIQVEDISILVKLQTNKIDNLQIEAKERIRQYKILHMLSKRYQNIEISHWELYEQDQNDQNDEGGNQQQDNENNQNDEYIVIGGVSPV